MNHSNLYGDIAEAFMLSCSSLASIIGYLNRKKHYALRTFYLYPLASSAHTVLFYLVLNCSLKREMSHAIIYCSEDVFLLIEFFLIYHFFQHTLKSKSIKKLLYLIQIAYILIVCCLWIGLKSYFKLVLNLYILQTVSILLPVSLYYFGLIKSPPLDKLSHLPAFWITTGVTIYFGCTAPIFFLKDFIFNSIKEHLNEENLFLINYFAYGIMFLFITKAYICPEDRRFNKQPRLS
jgi:hypothetical protein